MTRALEFVGELRPAFVAHLAERLTDALCASTETHGRSAGCKTPVRTHSVLLFLLEKGPATLTDIARTDGQSHQLLASRLKPLERLDLIERLVDPDDARRHPYKLTRLGETEARAIRADIGANARAMEDLFTEIGVNLVDALDDALEALRVRPLGDRMADHLSRNGQSVR